MKSINNRFRIY